MAPPGVNPVFEYGLPSYCEDPFRYSSPSNSAEDHLAQWDSKSFLEHGNKGHYEFKRITQSKEGDRLIYTDNLFRDPQNEELIAADKIQESYQSVCKQAWGQYDFMVQVDGEVYLGQHPSVLLNSAAELCGPNATPYNSHLLVSLDPSLTANEIAILERNLGINFQHVGVCNEASDGEFRVKVRLENSEAFDDVILRLKNYGAWLINESQLYEDSFSAKDQLAQSLLAELKSQPENPLSREVYPAKLKTKRKDGVFFSKLARLIDQLQTKKIEVQNFEDNEAQLRSGETDLKSTAIQSVIFIALSAMFYGAGSFAKNKIGPLLTALRSKFVSSSPKKTLNLPGPIKKVPTGFWGRIGSLIGRILSRIFWVLFVIDVAWTSEELDQISKDPNSRYA